MRATQCRKPPDATVARLAVLPVATTGRAALSRAIGGEAADNGPFQFHPTAHALSAIA
jgi:hypothetical protein